MSAPSKFSSSNSQAFLRTVSLSVYLCSLQITSLGLLGSMEWGPSAL